jgi:hypothetical protein
VATAIRVLMKAMTIAAAALALYIAFGAVEVVPVFADFEVPVPRRHPVPAGR